ncbi:MAG: hypothetical protein ABWY49_02655 [Rhizobium sp.]
MGDEKIWGHAGMCLVFAELSACVATQIANAAGDLNPCAVDFRVRCSNELLQFVIGKRGRACRYLSTRSTNSFRLAEARTASAAANFTDWDDDG